MTLPVEVVAAETADEAEAATELALAKLKLL
jgi:hypothetical protein